MKVRYFVVLALVLFIIGLFGMRQNNIAAYEMWRDIHTEGPEELSAGVEDYEELEGFVHSRMNASGPAGMEVFRQDLYKDALQDYEDAIAEQSAGSGVYEEAVAECDREGQSATENAECVQQFVESRLDGGDGLQIAQPYTQDFTVKIHSPRWTPDVAGIALLGAGLSLLVAVVAYIKNSWLRKTKNTG